MTKNLPYASLSYSKPVVILRYKPNVELGFPEIRETVSCCEELSDREPYFTFSDVRGGIKLTPEGQKYLGETSNMPLFRGSAILVNTNMKKFAHNFLSAFNKKPFPFKAFTSEEKAFEWLRRQNQGF